MRNLRMKQVTLDVPESAGLDEYALKEYLATKLYGDGTLSLGQAAAMIGKTKWKFVDTLNRYGVPFFNYPAEDFKKEFRFPSVET